MTKDEALDLALEALEDFADVIKYDNEQDDIGSKACCYVLSYKPHSESCKAQKAITAIKQALAAPVQEPQPACWQGEDGCPNRQACCDAQHCLYTTPPAAQPALECARSHPHENMDAMCELRTEIARLTNENARLKAQPASVQEPVATLFGSLPVYDTPPVQEPVAWVSLQWLAEMILSDCGHSSNYTPLLDRVKARIEQWERANSVPTPPAAQRQWVGLTDEEIRACIASEKYAFEIVRAAEAKLKEKNT